MTLKPEEMLARLKSHLVDGGRLTGIELLSVGHSNGTGILEGLDCVVRFASDGPALMPLGLNIRQQFDLFAVLAARAEAPPVPRVFFMEQDSNVLGVPFFIMERIAGESWPDWGDPEWAKAGGEEMAQAVCRQAIEAIAHLHRLPPLDVFGRTLGNAELLENWRDSLEEAPRPQLELLLQRLCENVPVSVDGPAPCHGDPKLPNMLWRNGELAAVVDWELAANGDPRWDLGYFLLQFEGEGQSGMLGFSLPGLWRRERFVERWERLTGRSGERISWFEAASLAKISAILQRGFMLHETGQSGDSRFASWAPLADQFAQEGLATLDRDIEGDTRTAHTPDPDDNTAPRTMQIFRWSEAASLAESGNMTPSGLTPEMGENIAALYGAGLGEGEDVKVLFSIPGFSLTHAWLKGGFPLPLHTHDSHCLYYIVAGSLRLGTATLARGDGFFLPAHVPYSYTPGEEGVEVLEFRQATNFDIRLLAKGTYWEKAMACVVERAPVWRAQKRPSAAS